ncbi:MAG: hypothetical protein V4492_09535 [Chlamydiota bacterium]
MSLIALVRSEKWTAVELALRESYPYISSSGGRYLLDEHLVDHGGEVEDCYFDDLCKEIYAVLIHRVFFPVSGKTELSDNQRFAAARVIDELIAFEIVLTARLPHVSYFAFFATRCFDFIDQSDGKLFPFRSESVWGLIRPSLQNEKYASSIRSAIRVCRRMMASSLFLGAPLV